MGVKAGQRVRVHGTDEQGNARSRATFKALAKSFDMEITHVIAHNGSLELEGVELTRTGREKVQAGQLVDRRVLVADGDYSILTNSDGSEYHGEPEPIVLDQEAATYAKMVDLRERALFVGYDSESAARVSDCFHTLSGYDDTCPEHPALRRYLDGMSERCEACMVIVVSTNDGYTPQAWAQIQRKRAEDAARIMAEQDEIVADPPTPAELAEQAYRAHYANACSDDPEVSFYASEAYRGSELALLRAIAAAYPDVSVEGVRDLLLDGDSVSNAVDQWRDDRDFEIINANNAAIEDAAWELLQSSPVQGPQCPGRYVGDTTFIRKAGI